MKKLSLIQVMFLLTALTFTSCAKKGASVRAVKQTEGNVMNPATSTPSVAAASAQSLMYDVNSISWPIPSDSSAEVHIESEIKTPSNKFIAITTNHKSEGVDSRGVTDDSENGTKLDIRARCVGENCEKYLYLATIVKSGYAIHQLAVISYSNDCKYNLENVNYTVKSFYQNLDQLAQQNNIQPRNDRETNCPE